MRLKKKTNKKKKQHCGVDEGQRVQRESCSFAITAEQKQIMLGIICHSSVAQEQSAHCARLHQYSGIYYYNKVSLLANI